MRYIFTALFILIFSNQTHAGFRIESVNGVSYSDLSTGTSNTTVTRVYGGIAGTCNSFSSSSTCNSCVSTTPGAPCNKTSVHPALLISFRVVVDENVPVGGPFTVGTGTATSDENFTGPLPALVSGATLDLSTSLTWGYLCGADGNFDGSCNPAPSSGTTVNFESGRKLFVGLDTDGSGVIDADEIRSISVALNYVGPAVSVQSYCSSSNASLDGICGYTVRPGDQKVKISLTPTATTLTNNTGGPDWYGVGIFYLAGAADATAVTNSSSVPIVRTFNSSFELGNDIIDGFQNGTEYCFAMGNVNKAQNIFLFSTTGSVRANVCVTPSEVVGLLDDKSCFISTAAFGSNMATEVQIFRNFRDHFLVQSDFGRLFIKTYYKYSPPLANFIAESEVLKFIARLVLYPFYLFSLLSLKWGLLESLFLFVGFMILISQFRKIIFSNILSKKINFIWVLLVFGFYSQDSSAQLRETKKAKHAGAAQGLIRIDKNGHYIYKTDVSNTHQSGHLKFGAPGNPEITTEIVDTGYQITFDDVYPDASAFALEFDYEYYLLKRGGKIGAHLGVGMQVAQGKGRLVSNPNQESFESFTFFTLPVNLGLVYRFEYTDRQVFVPYVVGGGTMIVLAEKREDRSKINAIAGFGFFTVAGGLLNLTAFDRDMASELSAEYDIKNLWLSAEFKYINVTNDAFTYDSGYAQAGFGFDF